MANYKGDYDASKIVYLKFTTVNSLGAPSTLSGSPAISVYKDGSTTQSTTGVTLTVDFDSVTGMNHVAIDTSADGTFYAAGSDFEVIITTGTVNGTSVVGYAVGAFSIRNRSALNPTTSGRTLDVAATGEAGLDFNNILSTSTVTLNSLTITGATTFTGNLSCAAGITVTQSSSNTAGVAITGNGSGAGVSFTGGATGAGMAIVGGGTSGDGVLVSATSGHGIKSTGAGSAKAGIALTGGTNAAGASLVGSGTGAGILLTPGATGVGLLINGGATSGNGVTIVTTSGDGIQINATGTDMHGVFVTGGSGGTSDGVKLVAGTGGVGLRADTITTSAAVTFASFTPNFAANSITDAVVAADVTIASVTGSVGSVTGLTASNLDATVSSRASQTSVDTIDDFVDTEVAAIKSKTDNLPADPADASDIAASFGTVNSTLAIIAGYVDTEVAAIKAKTDQLVFTVANQVDANALSGGGGLSAAGVRAAVGLASANLDAQLTAIDDYIDTEVATVSSNLSALITTVGAAGAGLTAADDAVLAAVAALNLSASAIADAVCDEALSGHTIPGSVGAVLAASTDLIGPGAVQLDWTIEVSGNPVPSCKVWVSTDSPYTAGNTVAGTLLTDDAGLVTFLLDADVVYYLWRDNPRFVFPNPTQVRYSSANSRWEIWNGSAYIAWT